MTTFSQIPRYSVIGATRNPNSGSTVIETTPRPDGEWVRASDVEEFLFGKTAEEYGVFGKYTCSPKDNTQAFWTAVVDHVNNDEYVGATCTLSEFDCGKITEIVSNMCSYTNLVTGNQVVVLYHSGITSECRNIEDAVRVASLENNAAYIVELKNGSTLKSQLTGQDTRVPNPKLGDIVSVVKITATKR